ncbi:MAG: methionine--tRNA ligase [bacterium]|nr:methionine--tRNA ligase [bacterium]
MSQNKSFYITTTLPYVNAEPHIGFAMELIHADIIARYKELCGFEVFFNTGTDEHGLKLYQKALGFGEDPQAYVDRYVTRFKELKDVLGLKEDLHFIRTTDSQHKKSAQNFWELCDKNGYIYKKLYKTKYCSGCELERLDHDLINGKCFLHPNLDIIFLEEENYFFKFSAFEKPLLDFYKNNPDFVIPNYRLNEIRVLIERGLEDFSISRLKEKMPWGIDVPGDDKHVMYVWFDALVNYISTIGWPDSMREFEKWWPVVQFAGKDQIRQQAAMWQAMLMAVGLPPSRQIVIHGFINYEGQKMAKSLGNVVSPQEVIAKYGLDALRYFIAREFNQFEDTDVSWDKLKIAYNANLANGLGNLVSRVMKLAETRLSQPVIVKSLIFDKELASFLDKFEIQKAMNYIWMEMGDLDALIQEKKPWESKDREVIADLVIRLAQIGFSLTPFMPETSAKILSAIKENKMPASLFPRKDA